MGKAAKPGIELLLTRWGKSGVFLNHSAAASQTVFSAPSLRAYSYHEFADACE
jgi:hypothetical protein